MTRTVLLVEDAAEIAMLVEALLGTLEGVRVVTASDGAAGLAQAQRLQPDLVLLDLSLPLLDGADVLARLRSDPATRHLHVVAFTGSEDDDVARLPVDAVLRKPFTADELLGSVSRLLLDRAS